MQKKTKIILFIAAIVGIILIGGIIAYLTDSDAQANVFTVGKVKIDLQEPTWDAGADTNNNGIPDYAENLVPNKTIAKDPQVKNVGSNDAYVYLKVTVPAEQLVTAEANGTKVNGGVTQSTQLFSYTPKANWTEIETQRKTNTNTETSKVESYTYVYYYNDILAPNTTTQALFDEVTFTNVIEGQVDLSNQQINIEAYAIQTNNLPQGTTVVNAYEICFKQENSKQNIKPELDIKVGDTINYSSSGTYEWNNEYATSDTEGTTTLSSASGEDYNITTWKVLSVDKEAGKIEMVPTSSTTGTVTLQGAQGYNNAVYLLNEACNSLYSNKNKGITARSITEEDFVKAGGTAWTDYRAAYKNTTISVTYGNQYTSEYTFPDNYYPSIYKQEINSVIDRTTSTSGYSQSQQTRLIGRTDDSATKGYLKANTSIKPYQTFYTTPNYKTASLLGDYAGILLPKGTSTNYWVASRCVKLYSSRCDFNVYYVASGSFGENIMFRSHVYAGSVSRELFPVVSLSSEILEKTATDGVYNVQ